jgi:hypothetical protein
LVVGLGLLGCSSDDDTRVVGLANTPSAEPSGAAGAPGTTDDPSAPATGEPSTGDGAPGDGAAGSGGNAAGAASRFVLASITIDADGNRVSYAQLVDHLSGDFDNSRAIEAPGNATFLARGSDFFYGLAEAPTWVRYSTQGGSFAETGRLSFANFGLTYMDFSNVIVDADTAVSVLTSQAVAVVWNPTTMSVVGTIDLSHLVRAGYSLEAWTVVAHDGLVYVPGRWADWEGGEILQRMSLTVLDPATLSVVAVAEDERCGAGGQVTFDSRGYAYMMGDGRNQMMQVFAAARGEPVVPNCLLRVAPGGADFEEDYFFEIPALTGGLDAMTELQSATLTDGIGFAMMQYPERISADLDQVNFEHWDTPAYKMWRIVLGDTPTAEVVGGANFSVVGFSPASVAGKLYNPESDDGSESRVYEIDPTSNTASLRFTMDGYFAGLLPLTP